MSLERTLNLISATLGFLGAILLAKGILKLTPEIIAVQVQTYLGFNGPQLESIAEQKADVVSGSILIAIAFLLQIATLIFIRKDVEIFESYWGGTFLSLGVASLIIAMMFFLDSSLKKRYELQTRKVMATISLKRNFEEKYFTLNTIDQIKEEAKVILNFEQKENENIQEFLTRYSNYLNVEMKSDINWSEFNKNQKMHNK